ncbi:60 kDa SS-A/Ro ribonucleoprotein-like [Ostrinia furnacalis]|uniref:60 kDa SS-A/Ro ribonucleoprotein-like n=1 Tax=Ostrinia furnacalis TaxID=93504 RepID=UPI001040DEA3|nr:60 kDa SS-A/Ro ribonucleoprotein-like [Ostrinia furnacalis]XP_028173082.1 60 kDa SS-A/Ro ribonucleoprotein-like [Ostrinia furnacalis]
MSTPTLNTSVRNKITRFLHTGNEAPKYFPGCWSAQKYFEADRLTALNVALADGVNNVEVVSIILKAYKDGWYTRFETIAFALGKCLMLGSQAVKEATYKAAAEVCRTSEQMMLFNKFTRLLKTGNGRGWCKHLKKWYSEKDPMELAKEMSRVKARHGRSHKTLLRKCHLKIEPTDQARDAVVKYAIFGYKRAKQLVGDKPGTKEVFDYIQKVEDIRHCEDPVAAAAMVTQHQFTLDHIPGHLITSQEVWNAVLPQFSLKELLYNIQRIHNMGFLTNDSTTTAILLSMLNNQDIIKKSNITPLEVYITMCNYKKKYKPMKFEKVKVASEKETRRRARQMFDSNTGLWEWIVTRRHPKEVKYWGIDQPPNQAVIAALSKLMDQTWLLTPPTNKRYLITLDMRHHMFKGRHFCKGYTVPKKGKKTTPKPTAPAAGGDTDTEKKSKKHLYAECFHHKTVTPGHAAIILALQLLKREKNVKIAVFSEDGVQVVNLERNFSSVDEAEFILRKANLGRVQLDAPIEWAIKNNYKADVFINMVDRCTRYMELELSERGGRGPGGRFGPPPPPGGLADRCPVRALERYRQKGVGDAKLAVLSLASHRVGTTDGSHSGVLDIVGIDEHVPKVLDAFTLGQFL